MMSHPAFKGFLNDPNFAGIIIKALSERYAGNDLVEAAVALATDAGGQWLAMQLNNSVVQIDAVKILHLASRHNQIGVIKFLSKYIPAEHLGAIVNQDINDETTLMVAVFFGHLGVVERLLAIPGIDTNKASKSGKTALILASQYGHLAIVERLLAMPGIDVNQIDQQGFTALAWAAYKGHLAIVERLLAVPGINVTMHQQGQQALLVAIRGDYPAIVQRLLAIPGIDVNKKTNKGQSPLWFAQHSTKPNKDAIIKLLKDHGATE